MTFEDTQHYDSQNDTLLHYSVIINRACPKSVEEK